MRYATSILALYLLSSCATVSAHTESESTITASIVVATTNGYRIAGDSVWEGRYLCPQGVTGLTLELSGNGTAEVSAIFRFYAVPENPGVPTGSFTLRGVIRGDGTIDLVPERWLERPDRYLMVGMTGVLDRASGVMRGRIAAVECDGFDLHRVR